MIIIKKILGEETIGSISKDTLGLQLMVNPKFTKSYTNAVLLNIPPNDNDYNRTGMTVVLQKYGGQCLCSIKHDITAKLLKGSIIELE